MYFFICRLHIIGICNQLKLQIVFPFHRNVVNYKESGLKSSEYTKIKKMEILKKLVYKIMKYITFLKE